MSKLIKEVLEILLGKKTVAHFNVGDFIVRIAILPGVNTPREIDREQLDAAFKEAMDNVLIELAARKVAQRKTTTKG